jgi:hypothetical protein
MKGTFRAFPKGSRRELTSNFGRFFSANTAGKGLNLIDMNE